MTPSLLNLGLQSAFAAAVTAYALIRGGPRVRGAAAVYAAGWVVATAANFLIKPVGPHLIINCVSDTLVAVALLYSALRHDSAWLGVAVIAQGLGLALETFSIAEWSGFAIHQRLTIAVVLNSLGVVALIGILGFAIAERRRLATGLSPRSSGKADRRRRLAPPGARRFPLQRGGSA
jgi:hypothetical protein